MLVMNKFLTINNILISVIVLLAVGIVIIWLLPSKTAFNQDGASFDTSSFQSYERAEIIAVLDESTDESVGVQMVAQNLRVKLLSGSQAGSEIETQHTRVGTDSALFKVGDKVVLGQLLPEQSDVLLFGEKNGGYVVVDHWRLPGVITVVLIFCLLAIIIGRSYGLRSLIGLAATGVILLIFTAPQLLAGKDAVLVSGLSAGIIATLGLFLAHGFTLRSKLAVLSTLISLVVAVLVSALFVDLAQLFGFGQSDSFTLQAGYLGQVDLRGLLFGGMVIALLGVLDDVTTTQTATVSELHAANPNYNLLQLFSSAMKVGREHIASLINTLVLVYVGASLPLFLLLVAGSDQPVWTLLNSEFIAEEIVRALAGSSALVLAVPIASWLAAWYLTRSE